MHRGELSRHEHGLGDLDQRHRLVRGTFTFDLLDLGNMLNSHIVFALSYPQLIIGGRRLIINRESNIFGQESLVTTLM